ncbi:MAG: choline/ethanolamine kinase family protein, partial [Ilumatobacteraceae bacterium]
MTDGEAIAVLRTAVLRSFPEWPPAEVSLEALTGGITNRNAIVSVASEPRRFVARLPGERTELLGIDRANEAEAARRAAELGIGPPVLGELHGVGTLVTELVPGTHLEPSAFVARLDDVVSLIKRFHGSGPLAGAFPIHRIVEAHARDAAARDVTLPQAFEHLQALSARIESAFAASPDAPVACHNDLLPGNVLFDVERAWLLDFEYAGMNDPFFDLGNLAVNCAFDAPTERRLVERYLGGPSASGDAR